MLKVPNKNKVRYLLLPLTGIVLVIAAGYARRWSFFNRLVHTFLPTPEVQSLGHIVLFLVVGISLLLLVPDLRKRVALYVVIMFIMASGQELLEISLRRLPNFGEVIDLLMDLVGAVFGYFLFMLGSRLYARHKVAADNPELPEQDL